MRKYKQPLDLASFSAIYYLFIYLLKKHIRELETNLVLVNKNSGISSLFKIVQKFGSKKKLH